MRSSVYFLMYTEFDTSCFSGTYVTGQTIGDGYFTRLHELRNDTAQSERRGEATPGKKRKHEVDTPATPSYNGCESMSNDKRAPQDDGHEGCEALSNKPNEAVP